jgi:hypothetical protein
VLQTLDSGHEDFIHGAEIDYYGLNLATCSSDNTIKVGFIELTHYGDKNNLKTILRRFLTSRTVGSV